MDLSRIKVIKLNGEILWLGENLEEVVKALDEDGCLLLKEATDLTPVEPDLSINMNSLDAVKKEIVLNEVSYSQWLFESMIDERVGS